MRVGNTQHDPRPVRSGPREWHGQGIHTAPLLGNWRFRLPPSPLAGQWRFLRSGSGGMPETEMNVRSTSSHHGWTAALK
jgi:hypothetical protein